MKIILLVLLAINGIVFVGSVLMMSPKGGLGVGLGGASAGSGDYSSKKSIESKLKMVAMITAIVFVALALFIPFIG